ncbi:MAG: shikimate kinase [Dehalococcoidales bacterium]|nr:shikimate kinase [Dehalococcoidales bacterium]
MEAQPVKTNIALIGFMGTGKSSVGRTLARRLGRKFIELDALIEQKAGKSIPEIFHHDGEIGFRELEIQTIKGIEAEKNVVIACGGGVVLNKINIDRLKEGGVIIYLKASPNVILKRTSRDNLVRPLLNVEDPVSRIQELLKFRKPFYERAADITINTTRLNVDGVVGEIIETLKGNESFHI